MRRTIGFLACLVSVALVIACSSVAFTGRNRMLLYSDSEIASLSNESYNEMMTTAKVSDNKAQAAMIQEVGGAHHHCADQISGQQGGAVTSGRHKLEFQTGQ